MPKPRVAVDQIAVHEIRVRPALPNDMPAVEELLTKTNLPVEGVMHSIASFVVAESDGRVVGVGGVEQCGDFGLLRSVAVDPLVRGRGVGAAVTKWLIADSEASGLRALYLLTTTAEKYFPSFGFDETPRDAVPSEIQQTAEFKHLCPSSATVMHRTLGQDAQAPR
jgi:amino-acid N-acetyltransferase